MSERDRFQAWIREGVKWGWISEPVCETHEGAPLNMREEQAFEEGDDPCVPVVRVYGLERVL